MLFGYAKNHSFLCVLCLCVDAGATFYPCRPVGQKFSYLGHAKIDRALPFDRLKEF
jgi:hypothetical protein